MNKLVLSEYQECLLLVEYLELLKTQGKVQLYSHIPNSTYTASWSVKMKNKKLGVEAGVPDYLIVFKDRIIFIEMKREEKSVTSPEQLIWLEALMNAGINAYVCLGFNSAKIVIEANLE